MAQTKIHYKSTRGGSTGSSFEDALLAAYAKDGGLYIPESLPLIREEQLIEWALYSFPLVCAEILHLFTGIEIELLREMTTQAYADFNDGGVPIPMRKIDDIIILDASLGSTLSFKDVGQQVVARLLDYVLSRRKRKANIVVETSGDTGPAAIAAVRSCPNIEIFCLYPFGRISRIQELQMVSVDAPNVHVFRTDGNTDEQASVLKEIFLDEEFVRKFHICSVNSINWFRIAAQSSYYVWAYLQVYNTRFSIGKPVNFCIPTGAFGNAMGGFLAKLMGLPIGRICCATNNNDIVHRTISHGDLSMQNNVATVSPAMDIQFAYNLERMLYYVCNQNSAIVDDVMSRVEKQYAFVPGASGVQLDPIIVRRIQETFSSVSVSDEHTLETMSWMKKRHEVFVCPHSATAIYGARESFATITQSNPMICVMTAHPAKFAETVEQATGEQLRRLPASVTRLENCTPKFEWLRKADINWRLEWMQVIKRAIETVNSDSSEH